MYNKPDRILITSQMFRQYLEQQHGVADESIRAIYHSMQRRKFDMLPLRTEQKEHSRSDVCG